MNIGNKYICLKDIRYNEQYTIHIKGMILDVLSTEVINGDTFVRVTNGKDLYNIVDKLILDRNYFEMIQ